MWGTSIKAATHDSMPRTALRLHLHCGLPNRRCYRGVVQREQALGPALVVFGVILIIVLAIARDDVLVGIVIGVPLIIAGVVLFVRARSDER